MRFRTDNYGFFCTIFLSQTTCAQHNRFEFSFYTKTLTATFAMTLNAQRSFPNQNTVILSNATEPFKYFVFEPRYNFLP